MELQISLNENDPKVLHRSKKSILNRFNRYRYNDLQRANNLGAYLVILREFKQAERFLRSYIVYDPLETREDIWVENGEGLSLLLHLYRMSGMTSSYNNCLSVLLNNDLWPIKPCKSKWIKNHIDDIGSVIDYSLKDTQTNRCKDLVREYVVFVYFYEIVCIHERCVGSVGKEIKSRFFLVRDLLRRSLCGRGIEGAQKFGAPSGA